MMQFPIITTINESLGPIRFEGNRQAIVAAAACGIIRGRNADAVLRHARIVGRHTLTQERLDRLWSKTD